MPLVEVEGQLHAVSAGERAKEKAEPGTQIASRFSLVRMFITALCQIKNPSAHMNTLTGPSDRIRTCGILLPKQARYQLRYTRI